MDKFEYNVRANEIKEMIKEGNYAEAAAIADTIDWRRVKSVMMLCTVSDVYKINRRYRESKDILSYAYERNPGGRLILYYLCELSLKLDELVQAIEYYKRFVQLAPKDSNQYILLYKIYEAQEVSLEERLSVLEELKRKDYKEKWAYELAHLYHRLGLASQCVEECDELILWFGKGKYVTKALELKQLHTLLTEEQNVKLQEARSIEEYRENPIEPDIYMEQDRSMEQDMLVEQNVSMDMEQNASREVLMGQESNGEEYYYEIPQEERIIEERREDDFFMEEEAYVEEYPAGEPNNYAEDKEVLQVTGDMDIRIRPIDISQYNTINLQQELAESMKEILSDTEEAEPQIDPVPNDTDEIRLINATEVFFGNTADIYNTKEAIEINNNSGNGAEESATEWADTKAKSEIKAKIDEKPKAILGSEAEINAESKNSTETRKDINTSPSININASTKKPLTNTGIIKTFNKPSGYDEILRQEYDGQISLVMPEEKKVEKQITGQLKIDDILAEWERQKKEIERKRMEEVRNKVRKQTDTLFADFDESTKSGLLEKLEKAMIDAVMRDGVNKSGPSVIKVADIGTEERQENVSEASDIESDPEFEEVRRILSMDDTNEDSGDDIGDDIDDDNIDIEENDELDSEEDESLAVSESIKIVEEQEIVKQSLAKEPLTSEKPLETERMSADSKIPKTATEVASVEESTIKESTKPIASAEDENTAAAADTQTDSSARELSSEERKNFGRFVKHKKTQRQLANAIDNISMAAYTGNVIITGEESYATIQVAKGLIKEVQQSDSNFSGKVAKVSGDILNKKDLASTFSKLENGAVIIERASRMKAETVKKLLKVLEQENTGFIVILEDIKTAANKLVEKTPELNKAFNLRIDLNALDDQSLVAYARNYAEKMEYSIDDLGVLALHTRIADMQTSDHEVTVAEVQEMVEEAIYYADKKNPKHFFDILIGKRYDKEDMVVLRESDFMHY